MKFLSLVLLCLMSQFTNAQAPVSNRNIFIITTDGFRWQEVFKGADDHSMVNNK